MFWFLIHNLVYFESQCHKCWIIYSLSLILHTQVWFLTLNLKGYTSTLKKLKEANDFLDRACVFERQERESLYLLVQSPDAHVGSDWAKSRRWDSFQVSHVGGSHHCCLLDLHLWEAGIRSWSQKFNLGTQMWVKGV